MLLAAIHGGSARALTLAAWKSVLPAAIWCHDEKHSLASSALASEALRQLGHPHVLLHGSAAASDLASAGRAATARRRLSEARIGQLGPTHFNLVSAQVNPLTLTARFGAWIVPLSVSGLRRGLADVKAEDVAGLAGSLREQYEITADNESMRKAAAMHLALAGIAEEHCLDAVAVDCWNEVLPEFGVSPCLGFAWDNYRIACEGDLILALMMLAGEAIHGTPGYVGDFYSFDEATGIAMLMHCAGCASLHAGPGPMEIARQSPPGPAGQEGAVVACRPMLPSGTATLALLHGERLDRLHLRRCEILRTEFPDQMQVHIRIDGDGAAFGREAAGNHYIVFPGDRYDAWRLWADWTKIEVH